MVRLRFDIEDTGIGMSEDAQRHIFERFTQADASVTRRYGGTGLGTTIAKHLTELMGGHIELASREGEGTTFSVFLPFRLQPTADGLQETMHLRVLLFVQPDQEQRMLPWLERWGVQYELHHEETTLLSTLMDAFVQGRGVDALVLSMDRLQLDPLQLAAAIKSNKSLQNTDLILLAPSSDKAREHVFTSHGFKVVLYEPLAETLLFNALHASSVLHRHAKGVVQLAEAHRRKHQERSLNILLAEDNPVNQEVLNEVITRAGHRLTIVGDGEAALDALCEQCFDLVLLDMNMPEVSGLDVLKQFRFMDTSASTPVIMLSADALDSTIQACLDAGANDYLTKPVSIPRLLETLSKYASVEVDEPPAAVVDAPNPIAADDLLDHDLIEDLRQVTGSREQLLRFLELFEENGLSLMRQLRAHAFEGRPDLFRKAVHGLKGTAGTMGAKWLSECCRHIEEGDEPLTRSRMHAFCEELEAVFRSSCAALHRELGS